MATNLRVHHMLLFWILIGKCLIVIDQTSLNTIIPKSSPDIINRLIHLHLLLPVFIIKKQTHLFSISIRHQLAAPDTNTPDWSFPVVILLE